MENFEIRRDRFVAFSRFENPTLNLCMPLSLPDFRPWCKANAVPPFHFFLYCLLTSLPKIDNFMYRIYQGEVIKIDDFIASFTVLNFDKNYNYAAFEMSGDLAEFVRRSVAAGEIAKNTRALINTGAELSEREVKNNFYTTCMPWIDLASIAHPVFSYKHPDIPLIAWGKMGEGVNGVAKLPFSVQAHHGFVDGYHIHLLGETIAARVRELIG
jgi:chloramphenicol O-acetyltransferase type A